MAALDVHDGQTPCTESEPRACDDPSVVGPAMPHRIRHGVEAVRVHDLPRNAANLDDSADPAHIGAEYSRSSTIRSAPGAGHETLPVKRKPAVAVVVVSHNSARWLPACLESVVEAAGEIELDLVVVDSGSEDGTSALVQEHAVARLVTCENRGFAHANNRGAATTVAEWVLYLNPDTLVVGGTIEEWVKSVADTSDGVFGARQLDGRGAVEPSIRRFPRPVRWLGEALASERWLARWAWSGERVLDRGAYDEPRRCDWVSGAVMLVRREVLDAVGGLDERFFLYCEEPDLSRRAAAAGWGTRYSPALTVVHYGGNESATSELAAQLAYARRQYMAKHFTRLAWVGGVAALAVGYGIRSLVGSRPRRRASRTALATVVGLRGSPFE